MNLYPSGMDLAHCNRLSRKSISQFSQNVVLYPRYLPLLQYRENGELPGLFPVLRMTLSMKMSRYFTDYFDYVNCQCILIYIQIILHVTTYQCKTRFGSYSLNTLSCVTTDFLRKLKSHMQYSNIIKNTLDCPAYLKERFPTKAALPVIKIL